MCECDILLTGATGFIGSHFLKKLIKHNHKPVITVRNSSDLSRISTLKDKFFMFNTDETPIEHVFKEFPVRTVIHLATHYGKVGNIYDVFKSNVHFPLTLLENGLIFDLKRFINIDSFYNHTEVPSEKLSAYALSKRHFSDVCSLFSDRVRILHLKLEHVYGADDTKEKFLPWLISSMIRNKHIPLTLGNQERDFIYVSDVANALYRAFSMPETCRDSMYHVGSSDIISLKTFILEVAESVKNLCRETLTFSLDFGNIENSADSVDFLPENRKMFQQTGWVPEVPRKQGIQNTVEWAIHSHRGEH